jgi:hypothetical protein
MRVLVSAFLAAGLAALTVSGSVAADNSQPLQPGKPAGVKQAQMENETLSIAFGAGLLAAGIAIATTGGNGNNAVITTTTTTGTSP